MNMKAKTVLSAARTHGVMIATAESCTGGLVMGALTAVPGSSDVIDRGFITYSNIAKQEMLGVRADTLAEYGAVSEETAAEMAKGALERSAAGIAVSVTGIAGPGGTKQKQEGYVCFGLAWEQGVTTDTVHFGQLGRDNVRAASVEHAFTMLLSGLKRKEI